MNGTTSSPQACAKACEPLEALNIIASIIIDTLVEMNCTTNLIYDGLYGSENAKDNQAMPEPCNLESRLRLIRSMVQDINARLCTIQGRV